MTTTLHRSASARRARQSGHSPSTPRGPIARLAPPPDHAARRRAASTPSGTDEWFRQLAEHSANAVIWVMDLPERRVVYVSPAFERLWGLDRRRLYEDPGFWPSLTHPDDRARVEAAFVERARHGRFAEEYRIVLPDGALRWVQDRGFPLKDGAGRVHRIVGIAEDVTERKRAAEALGESEARLRFVLDAARLGVWDLDLATLTARRSPRHDRIFGYDAMLPTWSYDRFIGHVLPEDRATVNATFQRTLATGERWRFECRITRADGPVAWIEARGEVSHDDASGPRRILGTIEDITERKLGEAERRAFVDAVAHDLRNPLGAIKARAQLLRRRVRRAGAVDTALVDAGLESIEAATNRTTALIDEMLDAAHLHAGRPLELSPAPTDLVELARAAVDETQRASARHTVRLQIELSAVPLVGDWDRSRLERVLTNLLGNATKYSPDGGEVAVLLLHEADTNGAWAVFTVADRGIGIPAVDLPHIFERFRRGANVRDRIAGSGIGLSGAKQIVEQHGGTIAVVSHEGAGSTFTVRLPLAVPAPPVA